MIVCSGNKGKRIVHDNIVINTSHCPLCKTLELVDILNKKVRQDPHASFAETAQYLVYRNEQDIKAIDVALERGTTELTEKMLKQTKEDLLNDNRYLCETQGIEVKYYELQVFGHNEKLIVQSYELEEAKKTLDLVKIKYKVEEKITGLAQLKEKLCI